MKREEVKNQIPGITDAQLDWVMNQYGNGITREKATAETLRGQLETAQQQLQTAQEQLKSFEGVDVDQLKGKVKELEDSLSAQAAAFAFDTELDGAIRSARGHNVKAIRSLLDLPKLKASQNRTADIQEAVSMVMKDNISAMLAGFEALLQEQQATRQTIAGIRVGDTVIGQAAERYRNRMAMMRGGL